MAGSCINQDIRETIQDEGFWRNIDLFNALRGHTGLPLTLSTTPVLVLSSKEVLVSSAAGSTAAAYASAMIPHEAAYTPSKAAATLNLPFLNLQFKLACKMAAAAGPDTPRITVTAVARAADGALKATFTPTSIDADGTTLTDGTCSVVTATTNPTVKTWNFFGVYGTGPVYLAPGDQIHFEVVPGTHATDALSIYKAWMRVKTNAYVTSEAERA